MYEFAFGRQLGCACFRALFLGALMALAAPLQAQNYSPYVVHSDRGGVILERIREIAKLRALKRRVEIRGQICDSTCTMFLGTENVCVSANTSFGFHGPSSYGWPLPPSEFEHWSQVMASYYPAQIRSWFLKRARYNIHEPYRLSGADLIRLGVQSC